MDAVSAIAEHVWEIFEERDTLSLVLCDLRSAFDCVSYSVLLRKLKFYGLCGAVLSTFASYLSRRFQVVNIRGCGVPQAVHVSWYPSGL